MVFLPGGLIVVLAGLAVLVVHYILGLVEVVTLALVVHH